jgi:hypothetical protein
VGSRAVSNTPSSPSPGAGVSSAGSTARASVGSPEGTSPAGVEPAATIRKGTKEPVDPSKTLSKSVPACQVSCRGGVVAVPAHWNARGFVRRKPPRPETAPERARK